MNKSLSINECSTPFDLNLYLLFHFKTSKTWFHVYFGMAAEQFDLCIIFRVFELGKQWKIEHGITLVTGSRKKRLIFSIFFCTYSF